MDAGSLVDSRYEVCRPLSVKGGMGDVYLCLDRKLNRQVAVKLIKPEHASKPEYRERFQREVDSAIALEGYDVVRILDSGECAVQHAPYYVMEYLHGRDLSEELSARGSFELTRALSILMDVCTVIAAVHSRSIVHRDLKPSNLFLEGPPGPRRSVRVLDFGVARALGDPRDGALTQLGGQPGSPNYMSPEQHANELQVGIQADIWALGAILFEMVVGEKAWPGDPHEARKHVLEDAIPSIRKLRPELPSELDRIIQKCLEKDPADRYASVRELEHDLREVLANCRRSDETLPTFVSATPKPPWFRSQRLAMHLTLAGLSVLVAFLIAVRKWSRYEGSTAIATISIAKGGTAIIAPPPSEIQPLVPPDIFAILPVAPQGSAMAASTLPGDNPRSDPLAKRSGKATRGLAPVSGPIATPRVQHSVTAPKLSRSETRLKTK